jgi:dihydrofolate reductase
MRIVVYEFMSLDGVVQAPGGPDEDTEHGGWSMQYFDPDTMGAAFDRSLDEAEALLFGRRTWQGMAAAWPERAGDPFADKMNALKKYVVSRTLGEDDLTWNTELIPGDRGLEEVAALRDREGGNVLLWGSPTLVRSLLAEGLIDELNLMIEPIVLGGGKRVFEDDGVARPLELVESVTTGTGVQMSRYRPAG